MAATFGNRIRAFGLPPIEATIIARRFVVAERRR